MIFSRHDFLIFMTVILSIYAAASGYVFYKVRSLIKVSRYRYVVYAVFVLLFASYPLGRAFGNQTQSYLADLVRTIGSFYAASLLYFLLTFILRDIINITGRISGKFSPDFSISEKKKPLIMLVISIFVFAVVFAGYINASQIHVVKYTIVLDKKSAPSSRLRGALVSDIHLGKMIREGFVDSLVEKINSIKPDIVFVAGDIIDRNSGELKVRGFQEKLKRINSRYGVYACLGNHDMFISAKKSIEYINSSGMIVLHDKKILLNGLFYVSGRVDRSAPRFGETRTPLADLLADSKDLPVILMDHTPAMLNEAYENGIALQLSGHTHNGQMFPLNIVTSFFFDISYGIKKINGTQFVVTGGAGTWGPGIRIGTRPEVVELDIEFK